MQKAVTRESAEWAATVREEEIGWGKVMIVGGRTEGEEMEVRRRINGGEELHCCGNQSGRSGAIIDLKKKLQRR